MLVYPYETVLTEKLQTVDSLELASSRVKDLFDLYIISKRLLKDFSMYNIRVAIEMTFKYRNTDCNYDYIVNELIDINNSAIQQNLWKNYEKKHYFTKCITHHERWDGKGYPNGLKGEEIPVFSRIISITDAYEAMTADRPYRKALDHEVAVSELMRCAGTQFDQRLVELFVNEVLGIKI